MVSETITTSRPTVVRTDEDTVIQNDTNPRVYRKQRTVFRTYQTIWFIVGLIEALLAFRFVFEILGANPYNGFAQLVYTLSYPFATPFQGLFGITYAGRAIFDWSLIVAAVVYLLIGYALVQVLRIVKPVTPEEASRTVDNV